MLTWVSSVRQSRLPSGELAMTAATSNSDNCCEHGSIEIVMTSAWGLAITVGAPSGAHAKTTFEPPRFRGCFARSTGIEDAPSLRIGPPELLPAESRNPVGCHYRPGKEVVSRHV